MTRTLSLRIGLAVSALCLPSCATIATPQRCEEAAAGLTTVGQIAQVLIDRGVEPVRAQKLADAVVAGRIVVAAACAQTP